MAKVRVSQEHIVDGRLTEAFYERLQEYMGSSPEEFDPAYRQFYWGWWRDHVGYRSQVFRDDLLWRLERDVPLAGRKVLDFGCGTGSSTVVFAEAGAQVVGVEPDELSLEIAQQRVADLDLSANVELIRIPYLSGDDENLDLPSESFDMVTLIGVLEHMLPPERIQCIREAYRLLRPGGELFIFATPNRLYPFDHHTTRLWLVGWMPSKVAHRYAKLRRQIGHETDFNEFIRRGGIGISRRAIDGLLSSQLWEPAYERSHEEALYDFGVLSDMIPWLSNGWKGVAQRVFRGFGITILAVTRLVGGRPQIWVARHAFSVRKKRNRQ